jgi:hypothetical protein
LVFLRSERSPSLATIVKLAEGPFLLDGHSCTLTGKSNKSRRGQGSEMDVHLVVARFRC